MDTGQKIAMATLVGAVGYGIYKWRAKPPTEEGWYQLDAVSLSVRISVTQGWYPLDSVSLPVHRSIIKGWYPLDSVRLPVYKSTMQAGWYPLDSVRLSVHKSIIQKGWYEIDSIRVPVYVYSPIVGEGIFTVGLYNYANLYPAPEWQGKWTTQEGTSYLTAWVPLEGRVTVDGPYGEPVPLIGRFTALVWFGSGSAVPYGPSQLCQLVDGRKYSFDPNNKVLYQ